MQKQNSALIIGVGSIGKLHVKLLSKSYSKLIIVDKSKKSRKWCIENISIENHIFSH